MATQTITRLIDDLSGGPADETVKVGLDGTTVEIDLNKKNADALRSALAPYIANGQRIRATPINRKSGRATGGAAAEAAALNREIREWAKGNGYDVAERGRIDGKVVEAFHRRHTAEPQPELPIPSGTPALMKGTAAQRKDMLAQVKTFAEAKVSPLAAAQINLKNLTEGLVDAYSDGNVKAFKDALKLALSI